MRWRWALVVWTLFVWVQRIVNVFSDADLSTGAKAWSAAIALGFVVGALALAMCLRRGSDWRFGSYCRVITEVLIVAGVLRWTLRAPIVLSSDEWSVGFKVVHTVLWLGTVFFGVMAWREMKNQHRAALGANLPAG